ncbi:MAG TPA: HAMP domain-containing sensor histidine kinase [Solirubrobacteraceae bacterium]|nr:HAMP domain-containing sensor histidine kinase [Solirubrobacteraceae bacterium]
MSLRTRLLVGMVVLVAAGLTVAAGITYEEQRSFLLDRVDQQVQSGLVPVAFELRLPGIRPTRAPGARRFPFAGLLGRRAPGIGPASLPPGTFGELIGPGSKVLRQRTFTYGEPAPAPPKLPAHPPLSHAGRPLKLFTVHASRGPDIRYRAADFAVEGGNTVVVAVSLRETDDTLHRLVVVEGLVGGGVIVALVLLGWGVIRIGLLPLERIGRVASEIARGDLSRRVSPSDQRTEVGRLGRSLNEMLGQIEQAFRARRQSEDQLRRFLADASHELRTPLASIRGYAELFRLGAADDPATLERAMARIEAEATRMGVLVEDLLSLAALDQAPERPRVPVDLGELAAHATEDARVTAPDRTVRLSVDDPATTVMGDPGQLGQLLANLMRNAAIHTPAGTTIEVEIRREGGRAVLEVRDHGPGVPDDAGNQLFERFWRTEGGRSRGKGGAGLGLAIVKAIAVAHGGSVRADNVAAADGGGAVFQVSLPALAPAGPSQQSLSLLTPDSYLDHAD